MKSMSDNEAQDYAFKKLTGDLDGIESHSIFDETDEPSADTHKDGVRITAHGVDVTINPMNGVQTKEMPKVEDEPEEDSELGKLGL
jgi:hypothetical protein